MLRFLFFLLCNTKGILTNTILQDLLFSFTNTKCEFSGTINHLDFVLLELRNTNKDLAFKFFSEWIQNSDFSESTARIDKLWGNYINSLLNDFDLLKVCFSKFFNSDNSKYHIAVSQIISADFGNTFDKFSFSKEELKSCTIKDIEFILTKLIGYLIQCEPLFELTFSLAEIFSNKKDVLEKIYNYMCFYHIFEYPVYTKDICISKLSLKNLTNNYKKFLKQVLAYSEKLLKKQESLDEIKELLPPKEFFTKLHIYNAHENAKNMAKAKSDSVLLNLISETFILYGKGCNYFIDGKYTGEREFHEISKTFLLPRSLIYNRIEYERFLKDCTLIKRDEI